ncbi:hypothetical protein D3C76_1779960 [compost metagenome]
MPTRLEIALMASMAAWAAASSLRAPVSTPMASAISAKRAVLTCRLNAQTTGSSMALQTP